jgi:hypothetical protein
MKAFFFLLFFLLVNIVELDCKPPVSMRCPANSDSCKQEPNIWFMDLNNDDTFDYCLFRTCGGVIANSNLLYRSSRTLNSEMYAQLFSGLVETKNFMFYIYDSQSNSIVYQLFFDQASNSAILEDYNESGGGSAYIDETDIFFTTQINSGYIRMFKKTELNVKAMTLCNLEGIVLDNKPVYENQSELYFDLTLQPAGMYFIRIISDTKVFVKKVIYTK